MPQKSPTSQIAPSAHRARKWLSIAALVLLTVLLRVPGIQRPLVGHYATKSAMYAMMARNWALGRAPFWLPTTDCLAGGERGWHLLEIPLAAYLAGAGWAVCGGPLDLWGRSVSIVFSAGAAVLLYLLVRRWHSDRAASVAALVFTFSPASIIFGQSFMLEPSVVFLMLATLWCMENWLEGVPERHGARSLIGFADQHGQCIERRVGPASLRAPAHRWRRRLRWAGARKLAGPTLHRLAPTCCCPRRATWFALATMSLAMLLCSKIYMIVILLPLAAKAGRKCTDLPAALRRRWSFACLAMLAIGILPAVAWCLLVLWLASSDHALSSRVFDSLRHSGAVHHVPSAMLASPDFYWRLLGNLWGVGLTPVGAALAGLGLCSRSSRRHLSWLAAMALLVALLPGKFFELHYYTLILVPALSVLAGIGWEELAGWISGRVARGTSHKAFVASACMLAGIACSLRLAIGPAFVTPREDRAVTVAAAAVRELSAEGEPVATLHGAGPDLLYYCNRPGWALSANDRRLEQTVDRCRRQGARWLVVADLAPIEANPALKAVLGTLPMVRNGDDYRVYRLAASPQRLAQQRP
ncbi:MAG TPA: glycosyltransferase family 39 protein [Pirellulales bacterium]|nr:glycosyltransferase family 39 protein [Pirellulales bacterium]